MEQLFRSFYVTSTDNFSGVDILITILLPFVLSFIVSYTYKKNITEQLYSVEFARSLFIFAIITSFTTLIIGGNVARAFGLVGALSIIRFRTILKSPMETMFVFWSLAMGMACGTGFYVAAISVTIITSAMIFLLTKINYGANKEFKCILKVFTSLNDESNTKEKIENLKYKSLHLNTLVNSQENQIGYVYEILIPNDIDISKTYNEIKSSLGDSLEINVYNQEESLFI